MVGALSRRMSAIYNKVYEGISTIGYSGPTTLVMPSRMLKRQKYIDNSDSDTSFTE